MTEYVDTDGITIVVEGAPPGSCDFQWLTNTLGDDVAISVDRVTGETTLTLSFPAGRDPDYSFGFSRIYTDENALSGGTASCEEFQLGVPTVAGFAPTDILGNEFDEFPEFFWADGIPPGESVTFTWTMMESTCPLLIVGLFSSSSSDTFRAYTLVTCSPVDPDCVAAIEFDGAYVLDEQIGFMWRPTFLTLNGSTDASAYILGPLNSSVDGPTLDGYSPPSPTPGGELFGTLPVDAYSMGQRDLSSYPNATVVGYRFTGPECGSYNLYIYGRRMVEAGPIEVWVSADEGATWAEVPT